AGAPGSPPSRSTQARRRPLLGRWGWKGAGNRGRRGRAAVPASSVLASQKLALTHIVRPWNASDALLASAAATMNCGHCLGGVTRSAARYSPLGGQSVAKLPGFTDSSWLSSAPAKYAS